MNTKGLIFVISAPSGAGKTTICRDLSRSRRDLKYSISCTTRPKRPGEKHATDYYFLSEKEFKTTVSRGGFAEWAMVHGYHYGTPRNALDRELNGGRDVIMDIDVQGGLKIKKTYPGAVLVFVMTPTFNELKKRLEARKKDSREVIEKRLHNARKELESLPRYEYLVINGRLEKAEKDVEAIIEAEHMKVRRGLAARFK